MSRALTQYLGVFRLLLRGAQDRPSLVYDVLSTTEFFTDRTLFLNLGYWDGARTLDDACERLADLLGTAADLREGDVVCDCGFGFGDQDIQWSTRFKPERIEGINITASQVAVAQRRVAAAGLSDRIHLYVGSATSLPFKSDRFDKLLALETAFHYGTREDFFVEAFRVLRPAGRLALTDILPPDRPASSSSRHERVRRWVGRAFWQIPAVNMYSASVYVEKLRAAGFDCIEMRNIAEHVYAPFVAFATERLRTKETRRRMNPLVRWFWQLMIRDLGGPRGYNYVLVTADKPRPKRALSSPRVEEPAG